MSQKIKERESDSQKRSMPELPEVETIKLGLKRKIIGLTIKRVDVRSAKSLVGNIKDIEGKKVVDVWRRAKILGVDVASGMTLLFHLKMTGQLILVGNRGQGSRLIGGHPTPDMRDQMPNSHTRIIFSFSDGSHLYFNDQRRFGWIKIVNSQSLIVNSLLKGLGPEPLEKGFTWQVLKQNLLKHKSMAVKVAIMDQSVVSGMGNIYANETCFDAKIDPKTKVSSLSDSQFKKLYKGLVKSLRDGIEYGGATRAHFVDSDGHKGYFLDYAYVYGRDKHPCKKCGTKIQKISLGGRGTYFCPKCQP